MLRIVRRRSTRQEGTDRGDGADFCEDFNGLHYKDELALWAALIRFSETFFGEL